MSETRPGIDEGAEEIVNPDEVMEWSRPPPT